MAALTVLAGCAGAVKGVVPPSETLVPAAIAPELKRVLQNGDWLVARGVGKMDNVVASATNMPLSHAALYDADFGEVIEADGAGVHSTPLTAFIAKHQRILVIRPVWASPENSAAAVTLARSWRGAGYNVTGLIGLDMPKRYYCTQVALLAYQPDRNGREPNPIPKVIAPGQMYHWGRILYDTGP
jgi:uncharacterized protein YycO